MARASFACLLFSAVLLASICFAQEPGTFSTGPVQPYGGLILTTPSMSLGNGIDPPVVSNQAPVYITAPQPGRGVALSAWAGRSTGPDEASAEPKDSGRMHAGLIYPTGISLSNVTGTGGSLGEAARVLRQEIHPPAKRVYTNDDIARLSAQEQPPQGTTTPNAAQPSQTPRTPTQPPQQQQRPHQYTVPIGSAPPPDVVPSQQPEKAQNPSPRRPGNPFEPKVRETTPSQGDQSMGSPAYPRTASVLPLLGALGSALIAAGLIYRSIRLRHC